MTAAPTGPRVWLVRHARTVASAAHRLNGRPQTPIELDDVGRAQCQAARRLPQVVAADVCVASSFPRARATAECLMAGRTIPVLVDARLNELDYGVFEGGPFWDYGSWLTCHGVHARPPEATQSQWEGLTRMASALRDVLELPGRPLVIGHGLLASVLTHVITGGSPTDLVFPEAGYLTPVAVTAATVTALEDGLANARPAMTPEQPHPAPSRPCRSDRGVTDQRAGVVTVEGDECCEGPLESLPP
jgi:probable phosphoglycerate mutase